MPSSPLNEGTAIGAGTLTTAANTLGPPPPGYVSGDEYDMFKARAQAIMPGRFGSRFQDFIGGSLERFVGGAGQTISQLTTGPCGGGNETIALAAGAANFEYETFSNPFNNTPVTLFSSISLSPWYVGTKATIVSIGGASEIGLCGLYNSAFAFGATDGAGGQYLSLGIDLATSSTNLVIRNYQGGGIMVPRITALPIELGIERTWELGNNGSGKLSMLRDGVVMDTYNDLTFLTFMYSGSASFLRYTRSNTTGTPNMSYDWYGACFQRR